MRCNEEPDKKAIYVFLRKDLSIVDQIIQSSHVCLDLGKKFSLSDLRYRIVLLGIKNENKLKGVIEELKKLKIEHTIFTEPDMNNALTAVATKPLTVNEGQVFSRYRLLDAEGQP